MKKLLLVLALLFAGEIHAAGTATPSTTPTSNPSPTMTATPTPTLSSGIELQPLYLTASSANLGFWEMLHTKPNAKTCYSADGQSVFVFVMVTAQESKDLLGTFSECAKSKFDSVYAQYNPSDVTEP